MNANPSMTGLNRLSARLPTGAMVGVLLLLMALLPCGVRAAPLTALKISDNGRYFVDGAGRPFFWQGDTEWELFHMFSVADARTLLEKRRAQGFNVIQVMVTGVYPEMSYKWGAMKGKNPAEDTPAWLNNNPLEPNEAYFTRADAIVAEAERCGIILVVGVYHAEDEPPGRINFSNAGPWARWLAHRYRNASNIVWSMYPHARPASEAVVRATIQGLRDGDGGSHLITMHPDPGPTSSSFMHSEPWLSFNTLQSYSTAFVNHTLVSADYARTPSKPVVDGEARYENEAGTTALGARRAGYWACLAGGFYSYGHRDNWLSPQTWQTWLDTPGAAEMKIMGDLFRSLTWWTLIPDQTIFGQHVEGDVAARGADGGWLLAYLTSPAPVVIKLNSIPGPDSVTMTWIDPKTGTRTPAGRFSRQDAPSFTMPAGWEDALLLCEKTSR